jgi:hypothetical protein
MVEILGCAEDDICELVGTGRAFIILILDLTKPGDRVVAGRYRYDAVGGRRIVRRHFPLPATFLN